MYKNLSEGIENCLNLNNIIVIYDIQSNFYEGLKFLDEIAIENELVDDVKKRKNS